MAREPDIGDFCGCKMGIAAGFGDVYDEIYGADYAGFCQIIHWS